MAAPHACFMHLFCAKSFFLSSHIFPLLNNAGPATAAATSAPVADDFLPATRLHHPWALLIAAASKLLCFFAGWAHALFAAAPPQNGATILQYLGATAKIQLPLCRPKHSN